MLASVEEWGLGGRRFGTWVTWFLLGGDLYTAYTFVAVPALLFGSGAIGFYAVPYTIVACPLVMFAAARMWSVCHEHGYATAADFVRGRHGSALLALLIAITGIVATLPYIALQLTGIKAIIVSDGHRRERLRARPAAVDRLHRAGRLHVHLRPAGAGADRVRQGHPHLRRGPHRDHLHPVQAGRLRRHLPQGEHRARPQEGEHPAGQARSTWATPRWRWARPWPCSSTRTR